MIHHLARAFFVRNNAGFGASNEADTPPPNGSRPANAPIARPVKPRPITPWTSTPTRPSAANGTAAVIPLRDHLRQAASASSPARRLRICTDPLDARRTVIAGRFAEVCAALDRLVMEQEAVA